MRAKTLSSFFAVVRTISFSRSPLLLGLASQVGAGGFPSLTIISDAESIFPAMTFTFFLRVFPLVGFLFSLPFDQGDVDHP